MKTKYNGNANKGGVYRILNAMNGRYYYGSAKEFKDRKHGHLSKLRIGRHSNQFLQNDFNKCGKDAFVFEVVEVVENVKADRWDREQYYLDLYYDNQVLCYNFDKVAHKGTRTKFSNTPEETSKILSEKSKAMWKDPATHKKILERKNEAMKTSEYKKALKEGLEKAWDDVERREAASKRMKEQHASGSMEDAVEILKKAQPKGRKTFKKRMKEDVEMKKGYQERGKKKVAKINKRYKEDAAFRKTMDAHSRKNIIAYNESRELTKKPDLIGPDGTVYRNIKNLAQFAREHGLDVSGAYKLMNGKLKKHRGFKLFTK